MEEIATIISFFVGAMAAKNWPMIKKYLPFNKAELIFGARKKERIKRVKNEEKNKIILTPRKKVKRRESVQRQQLIKERRPKKEEGRLLRRRKAIVPKFSPAVAKLVVRKKVRRRKLARRKQLIKKRRPKQEGRPLKKKKVTVPKPLPPALTKLAARIKSFFVQPAVQSVARVISEPAPAPNYKLVKLPKPEELPKPASPEELKPAPKPIKEPLKTENTEGAEKEQTPKVAPDEFKPRSNFWSRLIKK